MGLLQCTKECRKILKSCGYKRGEYRIENCLNHYRGSGKVYGKTLIHMRVPVSETQLHNLAKEGLKVWLLGAAPILEF